MSETETIGTRTEEDVKQFYKSLAIVLRRFNVHIKNFDKTANYKNIINSQNVRNAKNITGMMVRVFKAYSCKLPVADKVLNEHLAYVLGNGDFNMDIKEFVKKYEQGFMLALMGVNLH